MKLENFQEKWIPMEHVDVPLTKEQYTALAMALTPVGKHAMPPLHLVEAGSIRTAPDGFWKNSGTRKATMVYTTL